MASVLVVDDDPVIRELLAVNLELEGYEVRTAGDGAAALSALAAEPVDLVLLDVMMPEVSGWEVAARLRADEATAAIPVIMLTAKAMETDVRRGGELGVARYVTKPFDPTDLMATCAAVLAEEPTEEDR